ncbi:hypothetical protein DIPPA_00065, partial [Diplonema papillatum]
PRTEEEIKIPMPSKRQREADDILKNAKVPAKSAPVYEAEWEAFATFAKIKTRKPSKTDFVLYLDKLHESQKGSSVASILSRLASTYYQKYSQKLAVEYPELYDLARSFRSGEKPKQSPGLSKEDAIAFMESEPEEDDNKWYHLVRQATLALQWCGSLRANEVLTISPEDVIPRVTPAREKYLKVVFTPSKQRGEVVRDFFLIRDGPFYSTVSAYTNARAEFHIRSNGRFLVTGSKKGLTNEPLGINQ